MTDEIEGRGSIVAYGLMASVALHVGAVLALLSWPPPVPPKLETHVLMVELRGMVADRQREAQALAPERISAPPAAMEPVAPPAVARPQKTPKTTRPLKPVESPVKSPAVPPVEVADRAIHIPNPADTPESSPATQAAASGDSAATPAAQARPQTTVNQVVQDPADALRQYLGRLRRKLQAVLVYPEEVKKEGYEGTPVVRFTITPAGVIKPGSLTVIKSSGHPALDASARRAAEDSQPFEPPPREMEVAVGVAFRLTN